MVLLYVKKILHAFAVAESGWIKNNHIEIIRCQFVQVLQNIGVYKIIFAFILQMIEYKIIFGPTQIRLGQINGDNRSSTTRSGLHREGASIAK